jgi:hypothetical protein
MAVSKQPLDVAALFPELELLGDVALREKVAAIWQQLWAESSFERIEDVPVMPSLPYPHLKHQQGYLKCVVAVARIFEEVHGPRYQMDHLIAGALLADASKLVEYRREDEGYGLTELGKSIPHAVYGVHLALAAGLPMPIVHMIASHSPNSSMAPATAEAQLLHWLDQADISGFGHDVWRRLVIHHMAVPPAGHAEHPGY